MDQGPVSQEIREMNREFLYDYRQRNHPKTLEELEKKRESVQTQRLESFAKQNGVQPEDLMSQLKDWANISDSNKSFADKFTNRDRLGQAGEKERSLKNTRASKASKNLNEFAASSKDESDLSERR